MEYGFIGGSMGVVVGEKITRAIERAIDAGCRSSSCRARAAPA
jgi:acetyl-CoA carboxylase beta subunit